MERDSKVSKRLGGKKRFFSDRRSAIGDSSLSLSPFSLSPASHSPRIATATGGSVSPPKNHISRYFPQTEGKNYSVSRKLISRSLFPSFISLRCSSFFFFFLFLRYFLGSSWITSTFRTPSTDHPMKNEIHRRGNNLSAWVEQKLLLKFLFTSNCNCYCRFLK